MKKKKKKMMMMMMSLTVYVPAFDDVSKVLNVIVMEVQTCFENSSRSAVKTPLQNVGKLCDAVLPQ